MASSWFQSLDYQINTTNARPRTSVVESEL